MIRNQADVIREQPHYRLQKTTLGVASVLLGTTLYFGGYEYERRKGGQCNRRDK